MSAWTDLGLPLPNAKGYDYTRNASIIRNTFESALPDQDQLYTNWRKTINVNWNLNLDQLNQACLYLLSVGYSWFDLELVTNDTPVNENISLHNVRLIKDYKCEPIGSQLFKLNATLETKVIPQTCNQAKCSIDPSDLEECEYIPEYSVILATNLYPVELYDELNSSARIIHGFLSPEAVDAYLSNFVINSGEIIPVKRFIYLSSSDAYESNFVINSGEIIVTKRFVNLNPSDAYDSNFIITNGEITQVYITTEIDENMASTSLITDGELY